MPTRIKKLVDEDKESYETLHGLCLSVFLDGECYALAIALNRGLAWPMIGLMNGDEIRHVAVLSPDGRLHDARGYIFEKEFGQPFDLPGQQIIKVVTEKDLIIDGEPDMVRENTILMARKIAESLWPELPWKDTFASRVSAFADELENLSRKHKLWIRSPVPASLPVIAVGDDDEAGYDLRPTHDGMTFTIERYFK